jgi:hypothetical protein
MAFDTVNSGCAHRRRVPLTSLSGPPSAGLRRPCGERGGAQPVRGLGGINCKSYLDEFN